MIVLDLSILNQKGTPMFNSDLTANRPAAGIVGRIFIAIDSPYGIFRDTGTAWDQVSSAGGGATIYTGDGTLTGTRTISSGGFQLVFNPQTTFFSSLTASTSASSFSVLGSNALTFAAGFSSSNIGNVYGANGAINAQNFIGNATFAQANLASAMVNVNKIDFGSGGHTITMTQSTAPGIRAMTGVQNQIQFTGSHNGTISHAAISQNLGFFRESGSTRTLTITNAYSHLINPLDDYGAGFTFTNRWGIYQAGASDTNYFAASTLFGTTVNAGFRVDINGTARVSGALMANGKLFAYGNSTTGISGLGPGLVGEFNAGIARLFAYDYGASLGYPIAIGIGLSKVYLGSYDASFTDTINLLGGVTTNGDFTFTKTSGNLAHFYNIGGATKFILGINSTLDGYQIFNNSTGSRAIFFPQASGNVIVNGTTDVASAQLQVSSTTKGFLPPRMTNAQRTAIGSPAVGLIVYCTDAVEGLYIYKSTGWTLVI